MMMFLLRMIVVLIWICVTSTAAQSPCDPLTEYESDDRCCLMCGPGTHMTTSGSCEDPHCAECKENEYQETHTKATRCKRQPYCDPNKNFRISVHSSKKSRAPCVCELGFHCSSDECLTCVPHTTCEPGFGAQPKGNHSQDTVCEECPHGTFSNESSWDAVCHKWTMCEDGYYVEEKGSNVLDNKCAVPSEKAGDSTVVITVIIVVVVVVSVASAVATFFICRRGKQPNKRKPERLVEAAVEEKEQLQSAAENGGIRCSEEIEREDGDESHPPEGVRTESGNVVTQEEGKEVIVPWQESQTAEETV